MPNSYVNLPAARAPSNARLDFKPLGNALAGINERNRQAEKDERNAMLATKADARQEARLGMQRESHQTSQHSAMVKQISGLAQHIDQLPDEQRAQQWSQVLQARPEIGKALAENGFDPNDHINGPKALIAEARGYQDPLAREKTEADIAKTRAQTDKAGYLTAGNSIYQIGGEGQSSDNAMLSPVFTAPQSEKDELLTQSRRLDIEKKQAEKKRGYATKGYEQKFATARALGFNEEAAGLFASGGIKTETDPITRRKVYRDFMGNELDENKLKDSSFAGQDQSQAQAIPIGGPATFVQDTQGKDADYQPPPLPEIDANDTLFARAPRITGFGQTFGETLSQVPGVDVQSQQTKDAMADFDVAQRKIKSVFSLSRRFPVYEQRVIESLFGRGAFTKPETLQAKFASLDDMIAEEIEAQTRIANDTSMPPESRKDAVNFINSAQLLRKDLGVPRKVSPEEARASARQRLPHHGWAHKNGARRDAVMADQYADFPDYEPSKALGNDDPYAAFPDYAPAKDGAKEPAGFMESAKDVLTQIPAGVNQTLAGLAALPKTIIEGGAQLLGADPDWTGRYLATEKFGIKDPLSALARYLASPEMAPEPKTTAGEISRGISEVAGASVPMFGAAVRGAQLATSLPRQAAVAGPGRRIAEDLLAKPGAAGAGEAATTVTAGTALGTARDAGLSPEAQAYATMAGGLAPTAAMAISPAANMMRAAKATAARTLPTDLAEPIERVSPRAAEAYRNLTSGQTERARGAVTQQLQQEVGRANPQALAETAAIEEAVPGLRLTTAERTESPTLLQAQREVSENISPEMLTSETARREANTAAIAQAQRSAQPRAAYDPEFIVDQGRRRMEGARQELANNRQFLAETEAGIASEIEQTGQSLGAVGSGVRDELRSARQVVKRDMGRLADQLGLNDQAANVDVAGFKGRLVKAYRDTNPLKYESGEAALREHPAVKQITELADAQSLDGLTTLRSNLQAELHAVLQNPLPGNAGQRRGLAAMIQEIDGFLDNLGTNVSDPGLASKYKQFRQAYKTNYIDRFERGVTYRALHEGKRGYALADEQVAKAFFDANNPAAARQYVDIFGGETPAIQSAAMDSLYRAAVKEGGVSEHALRTWLKRHREVLQPFPTIRRKVEGYSDAVRSLGADRAILRQRRDAIENSVLNRELDRIAKGTGTTEELIDRAMRNPTRMRELMKAMPEQRPAIARAVWERSFADGQPIAFIDKNREALTRALGKNRVDRGVRLLRALEKTKLVSGPHAGQPPSQPHVAKLEGFLNTGLNQISSRVFAAQSGRTSWRYIGTDIAGRMLRGYSKRQANKILMEAMLDPDLALELTRATKSRMTPRTTQRLHTYLVAAGLGPDQTTEGENDRRANPDPKFVR